MYCSLNLITHKIQKKWKMDVRLIIKKSFHILLVYNILRQVNILAGFSLY